MGDETPASRHPDRDWRAGSFQRLESPALSPTLFSKVKGDKGTIIGLSSRSLTPQPVTNERVSSFYLLFNN